MSTIDTASSPTMAELVEDAKILAGIEDDDDSLTVDGIAVYGDDAVLASATVAVSATAVVLVDDVTGTSTLTMADADKDTLDEMVTAINAIANWTATLLGDPDASSNTLVRLRATSCLGQTNEVTLQYENTALFELLITNVWEGIETALCRDILTTSFTEEYFIPREGELVLEQPTVTAVTRLSMEAEDGLTVQYTGTDTNATVEVTDTAVVTRSRVGATTTTTTSTFAANVTTAAMATTINALGGWTATVVNSRPSAYLIREGVRDAKSTLRTLSVWDDWDGDYTVDYDAGVLNLRRGWGGFWASDIDTGGKMYIEYTAGYATMPADVQQALLETVVALFKQTSSGTGDTTLTSEKLGDYSYTRGNSPAELAQRAQGAGVTAGKKLQKKYARTLP